MVEIAEPTHHFDVDQSDARSLTETMLTPELAARLLANPHPSQRRPARMTVSEYARRIKEGRWRLVPDAIMVDPEGRMFNGGHRCAAVVAANRAIPVYIAYDADPALFDVIDIGRFRSPYQFIGQKDAAARASASRVTLWYERRFDRPLAARHIGFDLHEILAESEARADSFDAVTGASRAIYDYTSIVKSVSLAAFSIAFEMGYQEEIASFIDGVSSPHDLSDRHPARLLAERFRKQAHRAKRREMVEDWTLLVRAFNLFLDGREVVRLQLGTVWPRVAESEADFRRRSNALSSKHRTTTPKSRSVA